MARTKARFGSKIAGYTHGVRDAEVENYATGKQKVLVPHLEAKFEVKGVTDEDFDQVAKVMVFKGLPFDKEEEAPVSPRSRVSVWDSEVARAEMSDSDVEAVIKALRESPMNGIEFLELTVARAPIPWKGYDKIPGTAEGIKKILSIIKDTEIDPTVVLAYEPENRDRSTVLNAVRDLLDSQEPSESAQEITVVA